MPTRCTRIEQSAFQRREDPIAALAAFERDAARALRRAFARAAWALGASLVLALAGPAAAQQVQLRYDGTLADVVADPSPAAFSLPVTAGEPVELRLTLDASAARAPGDGDAMGTFPGALQETTIRFPDAGVELAATAGAAETVILVNDALRTPTGDPDFREDSLTAPVRPDLHPGSSISGEIAGRAPEELEVELLEQAPAGSPPPAFLDTAASLPERPVDPGLGILALAFSTGPEEQQLFLLLLDPLQLSDVLFLYRASVATVLEQPAPPLFPLPVVEGESVEIDFWLDPDTAPVSDSSELSRFPGALGSLVLRFEGGLELSGAAAPGNETLVADDEPVGEGDLQDRLTLELFRPEDAISGSVAERTPVGIAMSLQSQGSPGDPPTLFATEPATEPRLPEAPFDPEFGSIQVLFSEDGETLSQAFVLGLEPVEPVPAPSEGAGALAALLALGTLRLARRSRTGRSPLRDERP